jgi:2-polyprenyl-6-methoxyphenol hydroxylase-like FAD-dependent oxidoreductase
VAERVAEEFDGWAPALTALLVDSDTPPVTRGLFTLPAGHRWDRVPGVTLLGDAAHLMPPNGEGANLAMQDGAELARAILAHPDDMEAALTEHERIMFARAAALAEEDDIYQIMFGEDAPHGMVAMLRQMVRQGT